MKAKIPLILLLFAVGVATGVGVSMQFGKSPQVAPEEDLTLEPDSGPPREITEDAFTEIESEIVKGNQRFSVGNYSLAQMHFRKAAKMVPGPSDDLDLRLAVSAEYAQNPKLAATIYERVSKTTTNPIRKEVSDQGLNRVWRSTGREELAFRDASNNFLNARNNRRLPSDLRSEGLYQYVMALQELALRDYHGDLLQSNGVAFEEPGIEPLQLMGWLDQASNPSEELAFAEGDEEQSIGIEQIQKLGSDPNLNILSARQPPQPIKAVLSKLAEVGEVRILVSSQASVRLEARSRSLHVSAKSLALLLDGLLLPYEVAWYFDEEQPDAIRVVALEELGGPQEANLAAQQKFWMAATSRAIRQFRLQYPSDPRVGALALAEGNLAVIRKDFDTAANIYEMVRQSNPRGELLAKVMFNKGKINLLLERSMLAIENMDLAVDQSVDTAIQVPGLWLIGQLFLELSDFENSIKNSYRALELAQTDSQKQITALTLAKAYFFNNDAINANRVLMEQREAFEGSELKKVATVLSLFSQYLAVEDRRRREIAEERLLFALAETKLKDVPTALDRYVVGRAYKDLGFAREAIEYLEAASQAKTETSSHHQILFALAVEKIKLSQLRDAEQIFQQLIQENQGLWGRRSGIHLSQLYLENEHFSKSVRLGESMLERDLSKSEQDETLRVMGHAYRGLGNHRLAAICFAGLHPGVKERVKPEEDERWK